MSRNFSFGLLVNVCEYVLICSSSSRSIRSTIEPRSPALRLSRSAAQVSIALYSPLAIPDNIWLKTVRCPDSFAEWLSSSSQTTLSPSRLASSRISLSCESILMACRSSDSLDFLAYRQYLSWFSPSFIASNKVPRNRGKV